MLAVFALSRVTKHVIYIYIYYCRLYHFATENLIIIFVSADSNTRQTCHGPSQGGVSGDPTRKLIPAYLVHSGV